MRLSVVPLLVPLVLVGGLFGGGPAAAKGRPEPVQLSASAVAEDAPVGTVIGRLSAGPGRLTYTLVPGDGSRDNGLVTVDGGDLVLGAPLDFETASELLVRVRATNADGRWRGKRLAIAVTDVNDAPTAIAVSPDTVPEGTWGGTVGTLSATDPDSGDRHTFALVPGDGAADNGFFSVRGDRLRSETLFDFETRTTYSVRVRVTDAAGATYEQPLSLTVTDEVEPRYDHAPTGITIDRDRHQGDGLIGTLTAIDVDPGDTHTFRMVSAIRGQSNFRNFFVVSGDGLYLQTSCGVANGTYAVTIEATDSTGLSVEVTIPIHIGPPPPARTPAARRC